MTIESFPSRKRGREFGAFEIQENKYKEIFLFCLLWGTALSNFFKLCKIKVPFSLLSLFYMVLFVFMILDIFKSYKGLVNQKSYLPIFFLQI